MPGTDFAGSLRVVLDELPDLPHLPELPGRGVGAEMTGRALALVAELGADLQPAGWRLTGGGSGVDQRRARSLLAQDLDVFEEHLQEWEGPVKVQVAGPWTLAATVERPRGDKVLADHGARRDLAQALAEGLRGHVADLRRRLPGSELTVQVDEPALPAVLAARVPTASGFGRHRTVPPPAAEAALADVFNAVREGGATPAVHCCASDVPVALLVAAGATAVSVDLTAIAASGFDPLAELVEQGGTAYLGVVDPLDPVSGTEKVLRFLDMVGLDPDEVAARLVVTPNCGLAGADPDGARTALRRSRETAAALS